jgi:ATP-binding cassette, subfamily B, bacterial
MYDTLQGQISIDGRDIRSYTLDSLRRQVSFVLQEPVLFRASVTQNIAYGKPGATPQDIRRAATLANADQFIARLPQGYETVLGEHGETLSGGQRQRIAIARAIRRRNWCSRDSRGYCKARPRSPLRIAWRPF